MAKAIFEVDILFFERQALHWAQQFEELCFFQSNGYADEYSKITSALAVQAADAVTCEDSKDAFVKLEEFRARYPQSWIPGFFSYDLKSDTEELSDHFENKLDFPEAYFFLPTVILQFSEAQVEITAENPMDVFIAIRDFSDINTITVAPPHSKKCHVEKRFSKADYMHAFDMMQKHIQRGDIYEVNLCQEFYLENITPDPLAVYLKLNDISPTPFSCFFKLNSRYILSASPERFLAKRGSLLISQPIKGTAPRGETIERDQAIVAELLNNPKELAENLMIVDLVRNDLTRSALPGTVDAARRLEVHTFKQVHQLISTVTCVKNPSLSDVQVIKNTFPAGSMTGAPKIRAMQLCEQYEGSKRGIYSGAVGYFSPDGDFDFNVVIRSILCNTEMGRLSFHTGGAITLDADAEKEYQECLLKASAILETLSASLD